MEAKLVGVVLHAVDGTKVMAQGSKDRVRPRAQIQEAQARMDEAVDKVMGQIEAAAAEEADSEEYRLPAGWRERLLRREQLRELAAECEINTRQTIHELEPQARFMKTRREGLALAYNAQTVTDQGSGMIVAQDVISEETDNHALVPILDQVKDAVGQVAEQSVGDAGWHSGEQLQQAEQRGYGVVVNERRDSAESGPAEEDDTTRFRYDAERDCCVCPRGKELGFECITSKGLGVVSGT